MPCAGPRATGTGRGQQASRAQPRLGLATLKSQAGGDSKPPPDPRLLTQSLSLGHGPVIAGELPDPPRA